MSVRKTTPQQFINLPLSHARSNCVVCSRLPYSCMLLRICNVYADTGLFVFMYWTCSWCLIVIDPPICPTYDPLHVLHCSVYIPLEIVLFCGTLSRKWLYTVLFVRKATFMLVCLNRLVTLCMSGMRYVNVTHVFCCVFVTVLSMFCVLIIIFFKLWIMRNGKPLFLPMVQMVFHSCCLAWSVISVENILFMYNLCAASLCSNGWLDVKCMVVSICVGFL
jgi:hypothetical protein